MATESKGGEAGDMGGYEEGERSILSLSGEGLKFLEKYFTETDFVLTRHHIDSYEQCVFDEIPTIIHSNNPIVFLKEPLDADGTMFAYRIEVFIGGDVPTPDKLALTISPPVVTLDKGNTVRRLFPNEARLRNMTYSAQINADILVRVTFTRPGGAGAGAGAYTTEVKEMPLIRGFPLFRLPILLRSKLCATGVADPARLEEMGECRNDYGGYFIVGGAEKVLVTREEQAFNSLYFDSDPTPDAQISAYSSVVSLHPETKQTRRVALYMTRGGEIRVAVPMIRGVFPLFTLFRALGVESDEEIVRLIFPQSDPLEERLVPSIEDAYPIYNRYTAINYIKSLTKGFTEAHVLDILKNLMLPHVPDEPLTRALYLAEMARETIRAGAGLRPDTDRDDMRSQRFLPTGTLVRELFNACYKDWRGEVILAIDTTYRRNSQMYQGEEIFALFADNNLQTLFQPATLNKSIMRGFRGQWGTNERNTKAGVLQSLARISYLDTISHTRRVVMDFDSGNKTTGPRKLHTSQVGYFCTSETPQGAHIGITKNMSIMTQFSFGAPIKPVYDWLKAKGGLIPVAETTAPIRASAAVVQLNGGTVGFTMDPLGLTRILKLLKWSACMPPTASVSFNTNDKTVRVFLDEGRPLRPLWHLNGEGAAFLERLPALLDMSWRSLVFGTLPATADAMLRSVRFFDPLGDKADTTFADYEALLQPVAGFIEYCDPMEINENYVAWWGADTELTTEHTHAEIHPSTMMGLMASMIPYSNHNQAPRNQLSNSQSKQGIGYMATNIHSRFDNNAHMLCYGEAPLSRTFYYENIGNGEMPYGFNCIIAAASESGYNQDDGLIINRDSIARGMFQSLNFRSYDCEEEVDPRTKVHSHIANPGAVPAWSALRPGYDYSQLDERGIIRVGTVVDDTTVLVGRYMVIPDTNEIKDASVTPGLHTKGRVDSVVVLHQDAPDAGGGGRLLVKIRIIEMRIPVLGDKFSSRHGQKGTIGMFVSAADMPRTADGIVPDVMVNPGGLISRMTVAQLVEMVAGRAAVEISAKFNATTFCNGGDFVQQLGDVLLEMGASRAGDNVLYSGITGQQLRTDIYMCPLYFMRLKHLTEDKVNARGAGKREVRTHQPTGGRANEGGLRIGEMERDTLCSHGISSFLQESMMKRGDATDFWICNGCGRIPIYNESENLFVCPTCDGPLNYTGVTAETLTLQLPTKQSRVTFSRVAMPYTLKLVDQEMSSIGNMGMRFITERNVGHLRETDWKWPEFEVEFKAGERGVEETGAVAPEALAAAEAAAAEAAAEAKPQRKKAGAGVGGVAGEAAGAEGAAEVLAAAAAEGGAAAGAGAGPAIQFSNKLDNKYVGFSTFAATPFRVSGKQIPAPDGTTYPDFGGGDVSRETWPTVEHYYQAMKFPQDPAWQEEIRMAATPAKAKKMGLTRDHPVRGDWEAIRDRVMRAALEAKFKQNPAQLALLQETGAARLEDTSVGDLYWGTGPRGTGQNRMGKLLEQMRKLLRGVRVDAAVLSAAVPVSVTTEPDDPVDIREAAANYVETVGTAGVDAAVATGIAAPANEVVPAETEAAAEGAAAPGFSQGGGALALPAIPGTPAAGTGGVFMFINPTIGGSDVRQSGGSRHRGRIAWGAHHQQQMGGGAPEQLTADTQTGGTAEITVTKEG